MDEKASKLEQAVIDAQEKRPSQDDLIEMKASEMIEEEKEQLRAKAEKWAEEKANQKAIVIANQEKELSLEVKRFNDLKMMVNYYAE